jgi:transposase-like protein
MKLKRYSDEFKQKTIALIQNGKSIRATAKLMKVSIGSLNQWLKKVKPVQATKQKEVTKQLETSDVKGLLEAELVKLEADCDLFRATIEYFKK